MLPTNNPMQVILAAMRSGRDPRSLLLQLASQDPQVNKVMQLLGNKTPQQQRQIAETMAKERGLSVEDIARQLGVQIPSNR